MTLILELPPDVEQALEATAHSSGRSIVDVAADVLSGYARQQADEQEAQQQANIAARLAAWETVGQGVDTRAAAGLEPLSDADIDRDSIYREREDAQL